ncbi:MAG: putative iron-regulated protein [Pseudorhodobacter sp.]|jgi:putative iron-regulated protein
MKFNTLMSTVMAFAFATPALAVDKAAVLGSYADIAAAKYEDSLITAKALQAAVDALIFDPSAEALQAAKSAWLTARVPYQQTEVYRFGNAIVDDWEGKVNAWPLDEGLIDYVDAAYGGSSDETAFAALNVVASPQFTV